MSFFSKSIRWRLLFWLTFLVGCVLIGFGVTAYQLHRINRLNQIDDELESRLAALSADFRGRAGGGPPWRLRPEKSSPARRPSPGGTGQDEGTDPPPPPFGGRDSLEFQPGQRKPELQPQTLSLFDDRDTNA